eukprot:jgi/Tetstr1/435805/TSEL_024694.t1
MTNQLRRDLEWWTQVHAQHNGRSMHKPMETAYMHADSSSYGWGAVLNNNSAYQARWFWYEDDRAHHITWKELRLVRHAVESFLPQLRGRRVLLHEDNTAVVAALANLTSRSPVMMEELRKLWHLLDIHDISIRPRRARPPRSSRRTGQDDVVTKLLQDLATETIVYPPTRDLFFPGRRGTRAGVGRPGWSVVAFRGTVGAKSLLQYYSSINKYFRDHQRQPVALGEMVADARRGLAIQQERPAEEDVRVALPAPVAADIMDTAIELRRALGWEPANIADICAFRAALATITSYVFVCRAESGISCETGDVVVDRSSGGILLYARKQKDDQQFRVSAKPLMDLPIAAVPDFDDLLDSYTISRDAYCRRFYGASPPPKFWSISPLESSATWSASATLTEWLREAYLAACAQPPTGFKWTSHSLRKGAASAASCVGVPLPTIRHMGDGSKNNDVVTRKYIHHAPDSSRGLEVLRLARFRPADGLSYLC